MMKILKSEEGVVLPLFALLIFSFILFTGVIIDTGHLLYSRIKLDAVTGLSSFAMEEAVDFEQSQAIGSIVIDLTRARDNLQDELNYHLDGVIIQSFDYTYSGNVIYIDLTTSQDIELICMDKFGFNLGSIEVSNIVRLEL